MQKKLVEINFDDLKPKNKPYEHRIGDGLLLRISPTGARSWQFKYSYFNKRKTMTIGPVELLSLNEVYQAHKAARKHLLNGKCPIIELRKHREKEAAERLYINDLIDLFLTEHVSTLKRPEQPTYMIERFIRPKLGKLQAGELQLKHIHKATAGTAPTVARKIAERLHAIYAFAIGKGVINMVNPLANKVKNFGERGGKTTRRLSFDEIKIFVPDLPTSGLHPSFVNASLLLLATGQRKMEILNAKWTDIDFNKRVLMIPQERIKTARSDNDKKTDAHIVHLSDYSLSIIKSQLNRTRGKELIFFDVSPLSYNEALTDALRSIGLRHFTPHDLRRTFATRNADRKMDKKIIPKILNHKEKGTIAHYDYAEHLDEKKEILDNWGAFLAKQQ